MIAQALKMLYRRQILVDGYCSHTHVSLTYILALNAQALVAWHTHTHTQHKYFFLATRVVLVPDFMQVHWVQSRTACLLSAAQTASAYTVDWIAMVTVTQDPLGISRNVVWILLTYSVFNFPEVSVLKFDPSGFPGARRVTRCIDLESLSLSRSLANMLDTLLLENGWKGGSERRAEDSSSTATVSAQNTLRCHCSHDCPEDSVNNTCLYVKHTQSYAHAHAVSGNTFPHQGY